MSCFLLFVTLISTFQNAELGRKARLWAGAVDIPSVEVSRGRLTAPTKLSPHCIRVATEDMSSVAE